MRFRSMAFKPAMLVTSTGKKVSMRPSAATRPRKPPVAANAGAHPQRHPWLDLMACRSPPVV
ncbi:hypothetical protein [Variovorax sp. RA8]|uniref:hypothetical protein n=1 Tax=Variovorax sp. (strain JCM 16519 / RA8) TaxID=662548 RepID=UPI0013A5988E|nr:hypothetical protein [Variovorax sp. RA8]